MRRRLVIAGVICLWMTGCGVAPTSTTVRTTTASATPTPAPSAATATALPRTSPGAGSFSTPIVDFAMTGPSSGWILTPARLMTTADDGLQWSDITPPGAGVTVGETEDGLKGVFFDSAQSGWVTLARSSASPYSATVTVLHTADGGRHWQRRGSVTVALQYCLCAADVDALNAQDVWMNVDVGTKADGLGRTVLERSSDGGWIWHSIASPSSGQVHFTTVHDGTIAGGSPSVFSYPRPADPVPFYSTHDGGMTWTAASLKPALPPPPQDGPDPAGCCDVSQGLASEVWQPAVTNAVIYVYAVRTSGAWPRVATIQTAGGPPELAEATSRTWFLVDDPTGMPADRVRVTDDAGRTWRQVSSIPESVPGNTSAALSFAGATHAWAVTSANVCLAYKSDCGTEVAMYTTADEGLIWTPIHLP